ncbi:MAG: protein-arginine deiminase family protein, partial [Myxococcota bacterium]
GGGGAGGSVPAPDGSNQIDTTVFQLVLPQGSVRTDDDALGDYPGLVGVPNLDDDDENGYNDWTDALEGDDDRAPLVITSNNQPVRLTLIGEDVRIWRDEEIVLADGESDEFVPDADGTIRLAVEFKEHLAEGNLEASTEAEALNLSLTAAPLIVNHHLMTAQTLWAMPDSYWGVDNYAMMDTFGEVLGDRFVEVSADTFDFDVWLQDEFEFANSWGPENQLEVVIDSIRDRGLDPMPEDLLVQPGTMARTWGLGEANTYDSFGNLEASPPVTVDGVDYPFGRIYYGDGGSLGAPVATLLNFLDDQTVQAPVALDTSWLCVGHVDEFMTFIPDPAAPKGFRMVFTSIDDAYTILDEMDGQLLLPRYQGPESHGIQNITALRDDAGLRMYNEDLQRDVLDPLRHNLKDAFGLSEEDIIDIPGLFEEVPRCGALSLIPGMVNLTVFNGDDGVDHLFLPDPFLRADLDDQDADPMINAVRDRMPETSLLTFVDNWDIYHLGWGEVHCGTNVRRTPAVGGWSGPTPLLSGGER